MKVNVRTTQDTPFKPVDITITVESRKDLITLYELANHHRSVINILEGKNYGSDNDRQPDFGALHDMLNDMYDRLHKHMKR